MAKTAAHQINALLCSKTERNVLEIVRADFNNNGKISDDEFKVDDEDHFFLPYVQGQQVYAFYGESGSGKTTMIQTLALAFTTFQPLFGQKEKGWDQPILVISNKTEDPSIEQLESHSFLHPPEDVAMPTIYWKTISWWVEWEKEKYGPHMSIEKLEAFYAEINKKPGLVIIDDLISKNLQDTDGVSSFISNLLQMYRQYGYTIFISKHSMASQKETQTKKEAQYSIIFPTTTLPSVKEYFKAKLSPGAIDPLMAYIEWLSEHDFSREQGVPYLSIRHIGQISMTRDRIKRETSSAQYTVTADKKKEQQVQQTAEESSSPQDVSRV